MMSAGLAVYAVHERDGWQAHDKGTVNTLHIVRPKIDKPY